MTITEKIKNETAKDYAYRIIRENIVNLELKPGASISDIDISGQLGISRTPVREAINKISEESGIIEIFPQRGMYIALIDLNVVEEVRFFRMVLERAVVREACDIASEKHIKRLEDNIRIQELYKSDDNSASFLREDNNFHKLLFEICNKQLIYNTSKKLLIHYDRIRNLECLSARNYSTFEDHKMILEAIKERNKDLAESIMIKHLDRWILNKTVIKEQYKQYFLNLEK